MQNVAVIGFGFMGMTHALNLLKYENTRLAAIIDKDLDGIEKKLSSPTGNFSTGNIDPAVLADVGKYESLSACLESEQIDSVHICVHTDIHVQLATEALNAGMNVFLEKPMTLDVAAGEELIRLAELQKATFMVGHVLRFMYPYQKLKKWIDYENFGKLRFLSMNRFSGVPMWGQWQEKQKSFGSSGGALFDLLIHDIDFVNYLFGAPDDIQSTCLSGSLSNHDYISAYWKYKDKGIDVKLEGGNTFHGNYPFQAGFMANFENASVFYTTLKPEVIQIATNDELTQESADDGGDGFYNEVEYYYQCIEKGVAPKKCMPESSLETIKLCYQHV